jgi:biopolymer transport protein ExbD
VFAFVTAGGRRIPSLFGHINGNVGTSVPPRVSNGLEQVSAGKGYAWPSLAEVSSRAQVVLMNSCRIDPLPYVGLVLVLLCAFMTAEPTVCGRVSVDLFTSVNARPKSGTTKWDSIAIRVTRDGSVFFGYMKVSIEELPDLIRQATLNGSERKIYLHIDARTRYEDVKLVLQQIQLAGLEKVYFITNQLDAELPPHLRINPLGVFFN